MTANVRLPDELGQQLAARRRALRLSKTALAQRAGKVREVVYRLEAGEDLLTVGELGRRGIVAIEEGLSAVQWLLSQPATGTRDKQEIDAALHAERTW